MGHRLETLPSSPDHKNVSGWSVDKVPPLGLMVEVLVSQAGGGGFESRI